MCGIAAIFNYRPSGAGVDRDELLAIRDHMTSRGPDGSGEWFSADQRIGLAHRRLAIIDLSANGAQPMSEADGTAVITFNGEIYNYQSLRATLEQQGVRFRSQSDTEVLLHLYRAKGPAMLRDLRGMYAFAIWDSQRRGLFLARDPFGIKPLYYADDGQKLRVASQVKALLAGGRVPRTPDAAGQVGYYLWGHVPEPFTLFQNIRALPAGSSLWIDERGLQTPQCFASLNALLRETAPGPGGADEPFSAATLRAALLDTVKHHLIADVPVGVFLSSGLDSTTLAALAAEVGSQLITVTLGFEEYRATLNDEVPLAEEVARQYGARHRTIWIRRADFREHYERLMTAMDQPSIDGVNTYFVSQAARQAGLKVALSGLGGDELFGGYPSFQEIPQAVRHLRMFRGLPRLARSFRVVAGPVLRRFTSPKYAGLLEYGGDYSSAYLLRRGMFMPWELPDLLDPDLVRDGWQRLQPMVQLSETVSGLPTDRQKVSALELSWYMRNQLLRDTDWASLAHSLEVRVPFVDLELLRRMAPWLVAQCPPSKQDMAGSPARPLPDAVLHRRKTGFTVPVREWLLANAASRPAARGLRGWARHVYQRYWN